MWNRGWMDPARCVWLSFFSMIVFKSGQQICGRRCVYVHHPVRSSQCSTLSYRINADTLFFSNWNSERVERLRDTTDTLTKHRAKGRRTTSPVCTKTLTCGGQCCRDVRYQSRPQGVNWFRKLIKVLTGQLPREFSQEHSTVPRYFPQR